MNMNILNVCKEVYQLWQVFQFDKVWALLQEVLNIDLFFVECWFLYYDFGKVYQDQFEMEQALYYYYEAINGLEVFGEGFFFFLFVCMVFVG